MAKRLRAKSEGSNIFWIIAGTCVMALSVNCFFEPAGMVVGGIIGISMILQRLTEPFLPGGLPLWLGNLLLNGPLFLLAMKLRGKRFLLRTGFATALLSFWMAVLPVFGFAGDDLFLTAVAGGALMGIGLGMVFFGKATTGGTDMLSALIQQSFPHLSTARILPLVDGVIILFAAFLFGARVSLYAALSAILSGWVADRLIAGFRNAYLAYIISDCHAEIAATVMDEMHRGVTQISGKGAYTNTDKPVLFCAVSRKQAVILKDLVYQIDPSAFLVLTDASEIRGEGFLGYSSEEF